jgi:hypothetical protein
MFSAAAKILKSSASIDEKLDLCEKLPILPQVEVFEEWAIKSLTRVP